MGPCGHSRCGRHLRRHFGQNRTPAVQSCKAVFVSNVSSRENSQCKGRTGREEASIAVAITHTIFIFAIASKATTTITTTVPTTTTTTIIKTTTIKAAITITPTK
eukprot:comp22682_c0_seq1/m.57754 comp22682_c0_seq1/g.57754  ORF comp22682_c0_seq1/g.57754 comp22682_c0_seq1/m.57754 type:complete len:105 (+) comp22682_c0_seq1:586-900(+)